MSTLLFVRHGQASFGQDNYDQLSPLGIMQAKLLGEHFGRSQRPIDRIISGSLSRQRESAKHFLLGYQAALSDQGCAQGAAHLSDHTVLEGLNEFNHQDVFIKSNPSFATRAGVLAHIANAPKPKLRLAELFNDAMRRWHSGDFDDDYLESWPAFDDRVQATMQALIQISAKPPQPLSEHAKPSHTLLIFTSGGVIAALVARLLLPDPSIQETHLGDQRRQLAYRLNRTLVNTGVTAVTLKHEQPRLLTVNEHSHLYHGGDDYLTWY